MQCLSLRKHGEGFEKQEKKYVGLTTEKPNQTQLNLKPVGRAHGLPT